MEKSIAAKNKRLAIDIPDDLAFSVLSKLPLKSLKRFGCIRKSWAVLFENPYFLNSYRNNFLSNCYSFYHDASLLLHLVDLDPIQNTLYSLSGERFENMVKLDWPIPFQGEDFFDIFSSRCINGIICLHNFTKKVVLWNPATGEYKVIPPSPVELSFPSSANNFHVGYNIYGFGYDRVRDDYKVIRQVTLGVMSLEWEIYNLRSNSWKKIDVDIPYSHGFSNRVRVYMDGVCHWLCKDNLEPKTYLRSFDLSNEVFSITPIPSNTDDSFDVGVEWLPSHLVVLNCSIALISHHRHSTTFNIAILGELGVKESWTQLFIIGPLPLVRHPIGVGKKGEIFFKIEDKEFAWFDLSTQMIEELSVRARRAHGHIIIYKESRLPIGGMFD